MSCRSWLRSCCCSGSSDSAWLRRTNVTPTSCGPAVTGTRVFSRRSMALAASDMLVSDARLSFSPPTSAREDALAVEAHLEGVRELEPGHVADDVAGQEDAEARTRPSCGNVWRNSKPPRVPSGSPSTCSSCESSGGMRNARRTSVGVGADGEAADLAGRRQVLLEQRRRHAQHAGLVVEPVALVVGRQQVGDVHVHAEQVADRVAVLGAVQAVHRLESGIGLLPRLRLERALERRRERRRASASSGRGMP